MTTLLIVEGNTPEIVGAGNAWAKSFVRTFSELAPTVVTEIVNPYAAPLLDSVYDGVDGVIFTGSSVHWSTDAREVAPQRAAMETAFANGLPVWGSCNGLNLAAVVLGGAVGSNPRGSEIGLAHDIQITEAGQAHPMMAGRRDGFAVPCIHRDEVQRLPKGAVLIAGNAHTPVQAMVSADGVDFWGTQYHPEESAQDIAARIRSGGTYAPYLELADDLDASENNEEAARRLGTNIMDLASEKRALELANWLTHVEAVASG